MDEIEIRVELPDGQRAKASRLYYAAFVQKLQPIFRDAARGRAVLEDCLNGSHAIVALRDAELVGIAGFQDADGKLVDIQPTQMVRAFGFLGGWARLLALLIFRRKTQPDILLMDGIVVDTRLRGSGIGSRLLDAMIDYARRRQYRGVRLDVVDTNPRARQLYERKGFVAVESRRFPLLKGLFGFSGATTMIKTL